ncbi:hypothetical protein R5W23_001445 [Gemmata sp. JC673]|uniref:Uncharacterized protein n=1 Tax=Gemmata algarum TaxID=2975278 RepID=A0ABU5F0D6_9BACT|nr:hypothetical protein [Gemmata algarum]MDY3560220.1 hypothetical protein [Gemmata algarum]
MNRFACVSLLVSAVGLAHAPARADRPVAPAPREIRPDGSRDPVPRSEPVKAENPAVTVERIITNSKNVGDKLEKSDTGADTRKTQTKILSDIDALINQQENPPPPKPDQDKNDKQQDKNDKQQDKNDKQQDKNDKSDKPQDKKEGQKDDTGSPDKKNDMGDMSPKSDTPMPKDGTDQTPMPKDGMGTGRSDSAPTGAGERRPRMGDPMNAPKQEPVGQQNKPGNDTKEAGREPKASKDISPKSGPAVKLPDGPMGKGNGRSVLPFEEEDASKNVWGHLPDKLRRQMSQYYKEEFTPKYAELLRLYYSSLADKSAKPTEPRK